MADELAWLGITHSHWFVREPQCNRVIERFIRTLKEQCIWLHRFESSVCAWRFASGAIAGPSR